MTPKRRSVDGSECAGTESSAFGRCDVETGKEIVRWRSDCDSTGIGMGGGVVVVSLRSLAYALWQTPAPPRLA